MSQHNVPAIEHLVTFVSLARVVPGALMSTLR